jgi:hypothetical protein
LYAPALELTKQCLDGNRFTGVVKNTGNIVLTNVVVSTGTGAGAVSLLGPIELAIGETATFGGTATSDVVVTATGAPECGQNNVTVRATCQPLAPEPEFTDVAIVEGAVILRWSAVPGRTYRVQYSPVVAPAAWQDLPGDVTATGVIAQKSDPLGANASRFYRVLLLP